jgi:hypothetical protein
VAEAVNFALKSWIETGKNAKACKCRGDSVNINMEDFLANLKHRSRSPNSTSSNSSYKKEKTDTLKKCVNCNTFRKTPKSKKKILKFKIFYFTSINSFFYITEFFLPAGTDFTCEMLKKTFCEAPKEKPKRKYCRINKTIPKKISTKSKKSYEIEKLQPSSRKSKLKQHKEFKQRQTPKRRYYVKVRG